MKRGLRANGRRCLNYVKLNYQDEVEEFIVTVTGNDNFEYRDTPCTVRDETKCTSRPISANSMNMKQKTVWTSWSLTARWSLIETISQVEDAAVFLDYFMPEESRHFKRMIHYDNQYSNDYGIIPIRIPIHLCYRNDTIELHSYHRGAMDGLSRVLRSKSSRTW